MSKIDEKIREAAIEGIKAIGLKSSTRLQKQTLKAGILRAFQTASFNSLAKRQGISPHAPPADLVEHFVKTKKGQSLIEPLENFLRKHQKLRDENPNTDFSTAEWVERANEETAPLKSRFSNACKKLFNTRQPVRPITTAALKHMFG